MKDLLIFILVICSTSLAYAEPLAKPESKTYQNASLISWLRPPKPSYTNDDLGGKDRDLTIKLFVSDSGAIEKTEVVKSSGIAILDEKIERAIKRSKFNPYLENGVAYAFIAEQPFVLTITTKRPWWKKMLFIP